MKQRTYRHHSLMHGGFYGAPNFGDELLAMVLGRVLRELRPNHDVVMATRRAEVTRRWTGINGPFVRGWYPYPRYWWGIVRRLSVIYRADAVLMGGGGLIDDEYTAWSLRRYGADLLWAILLNRPFAWVGLGAKPIARPGLRKLAAFLLDRAALVYCRDETSASRVRKLAPGARVVVGPDLSVLMEASESDATDEEPAYGIINFRDKQDFDLQKAVQVCARLDEAGLRVRFLPAQHDDYSLYRRLAGAFGRPIEYVELDNVDSIVSLISRARLVVGTRLHVVACAVLQGTGVVAIPYEDKVSSFVEGLGQADALVTWEGLVSGVAAALRTSLDRDVPRPAVAAAAAEAQRMLADTLEACAEHRGYARAHRVRALATLHGFALLSVCFLFDVAWKRFKRAVTGAR